MSRAEYIPLEDRVSKFKSVRTTQQIHEPEIEYMSGGIRIRNFPKALFAISIPGSLILLLTHENIKDYLAWGNQDSIGKEFLKQTFLYTVAGALDGIKIKMWVYYGVIDSIVQYLQ